MHLGGGGGGGYSLTSTIRVCAAERGPDFWTPEIEQGIYFRDFTRTGYDIGDRSENCQNVMINFHLSIECFARLLVIDSRKL